MSTTEIESASSFLHGWTTRMQETHDLAGLSVSIFDDSTLETVSSGESDVEAAHPLDIDTRFVIASQTKPVTAALILQLVEKSKLRLSDTLARFFGTGGYADERMGSLTIEHLLQHTSGLKRDVGDGRYWDMQRPFPTVDEVDYELRNSRLVVTPGDRMKYSNLGYAVLGLILEEVHNEEYAAIVQKQIIEPLQLGATSFQPDAVTAAGHWRDEGVHRVIPFVPLDAYAPSAGLISNAEDVKNIYRALLPKHESSGIISEVSKAQLVASTVPVPESDNLTYGLGMGFGADTDGNTCASHGGGYLGHMSFTFYDYERRHGAIVFANSIEAETVVFAAGALNALLHFKKFGSPGEMGVYEGVFRNKWLERQIVANQDVLTIIDPRATMPFIDREFLDLIGNNRFRIRQANGYGWDGEEVHIEPGAPSISYAGRIFNRDET